MGAEVLGGTKGCQSAGGIRLGPWGGTERCYNACTPACRTAHAWTHHGVLFITSTRQLPGGCALSRVGPRHPATWERPGGSKSCSLYTPLLRLPSMHAPLPCSSPVPLQVNWCRLTTRGGTVIELQPCVDEVPAPYPTVQPAASDRQITTRTTGAKSK